MRWVWLTEVRLNDCSSIATHATTPSSVTRLPSVCGVVVVENGNGQQHPKPSPALPSSTADSKKTEHCHDRGDGATHFHGSSNKIKHYHVNDIKKPECCRDDVSIIQRYHDDSGSESSTPHSESARRISVRQTELAYRFKEIVIRKMRGYMHVSLVSHTRAKNAVNPNVRQLYTEQQFYILIHNNLIINSGFVYRILKEPQTFSRCY